MDFVSKFRQISLRAASVALILAVLAAVSGRWQEALGVLIGCLAALLNFRLQAQSIPKILDMTYPSARKQAAGRYFLRYILTVAVLLTVYANPNLNVYAALVGLLLIKVVILGETLLIFLKQKLQGCLNPARWERGDK